MQTILVVNSDSKQRSTIATFLSAHGFTVLQAVDASTAQQQVELHAVALILLEEKLSDLSGLAFLKALRQDPTLFKVPVFLFVESVALKVTIEGMKAGATECIHKPINYAELLEKIESQFALASALLEPPKPPELGDVLDDKYRIESKIGQGGYGVVFQATHLELNRQVAIKVLHNTLKDSQALARFRVEGIASCRVQHPNAVSVFDFCAVDQRLPYLVLELLTGCSLQDELNRYRALSIKRCIEVFVPICGALALAHQLGIVHRDIKPSNIFLHKTSAGLVPKLLDFGMAKMAESDHQAAQTAKGFVVGTLSYMAPERLSEKPYDGKADIYSLGVTLYETLSGTLPFIAPGNNPLLLATMHLKKEPPPIQKHRPALPDALAAFVAQCLHKLPGMRPSAIEFAQHLEQYRPNT
jgi:serine/threonine protein kinase